MKPMLKGLFSIKKPSLIIFNNLKTRLAGEILQKFVNYHIKVAIYGDFRQYMSQSFHDFVYESNHGKNFFFVGTKEEALYQLINVL